MAASVVPTQYSAAQAQEQTAEWCNPVLVESNRTPVRAASNNTPVLHDGSFPCPVAEAPEPEPMMATIAGDVAFEFDRSEIRPAFYPELDAIAAELQNYPDATINVAGHTDSIGTLEYNEGLSMRRAEAVATYLENAGIPRDRMVIEGYGETQPVASNDTPEGRAQNRRVEVSTL
ncbi:OmpA family protein [Fodinicurvata sp. EGI_FJ10296]|uniref:OmpA family protein n=1 Tax=Fodinicurvata sp. EGI_FJ10296 TaxID=3231908 RepID=UPI00345479EC